MTGQKLGQEITGDFTNIWEDSRRGVSGEDWKGFVLSRGLKKSM